MSWLRDLWQDLRYGWRLLRRSPGFTLVAILTLALGIGANTAIFSVVSGVLLRPLPFAHPDRLVQVDEIQPRSKLGPGFIGTVVYQDFEEWRAKNTHFEAMATYEMNVGRNFQSAGVPEQVITLSAERGLFRLLQVTAMAGRTFSDDDPPNVAVASYGFWKSSLGGDRSAIGRSLTLDGQSFTLIGVMPEGFQFPYLTSPIELWIPWDASPDLRSHPTRRLEAVLGRLRPGVSLEVARQELRAMEAPSQGGRLVRIRELKDVVSAPARQSLAILFGAVSLVLLVACVNVANLLLARTASRSREIAMRAALGAGRFRLVRQFLTESLLLSFCGGLTGLAIGWWGSQALVKLAAAQIPRAAEIGLDWRVFVFLASVCVVTGIGFTLAPAVAAANDADALKSRGVGAALRDGLVVAEIALAFVLLAGAGLLLRTFVNLQRTDPGLNVQNVLTAHVVVSDGRQSMALEERAGQIPGVRSAGLVSMLPLQNHGWSAGTSIPGRPGWFPTELMFVTPGYFRAMGIALRRGREFSPRDGPETPPVILVNEAFIHECFPNEDPIGRMTDRGVIIGVVGDVRQAALSDPAKPEVYSSVAQNFAQIPNQGSTLVVRSSGPPEALAGALRAAVREVIPGQAVFRIATMQRVIEDSLDKPRSYTWLLGLFAAMGAVLAVAGIYGVVAYLVALRTRELGIRIALGADPGRVVQLVMRHGALLVALGLVVGISGAAAVTRVFEGTLYGVASTDPLTFAAMAALLATVAMGACLVPARRAARVDPVAALRVE